MTLTILTLKEVSHFLSLKHHPFLPTLLYNSSLVHDVNYHFFLLSFLLDKSLQMHLLTSYDPNPLDKNFHSLPNPDPHSDPIDRVDMIERSFSSTWPNSLSPSVTYSMSSPSGSNETWMQRLPYLCIRNSNLRHSNSAPAVDCPYRRRRLSLQSLQSYGREEVWPGVVPPCGKLRRTCSESNYADKGTQRERERERERES